MTFSRRKTLAGLTGVTAMALGASSQARAAAAGVASDPGLVRSPGFSADGPDAGLYGRGEGYPVPPKAIALRTGNPWPAPYRVGAFSHLDEIFPTHRIQRAGVSWTFGRTDADVRYRVDDETQSLRTYLARNPVTGLLIAKDDRILFEQYQYGRRDSDRLLAQSMTKSITGLLTGLAIADGALGSVDDLPEAHVTELKGTQYGRTPIRDLLHMASGVDFSEDRDGGRDLNRLWEDMVLGTKGTAASIAQFDRRIAPPGTRFHYASIEADVLALVLRHALRRSLASYLQERLWQPMGAEADATWLVDAEGIEVGHFGFSGVVRDYARLGRLLANSGSCDGRQILPREWLSDATSVRSSDAYLAAGRATPMFGYGYLMWLLPGPRHQVAFVGQNGQRICVDPVSKLVMVQTALEDGGDSWRLWRAVVEQLS